MLYSLTLNLHGHRSASFVIYWVSRKAKIQAYSKKSHCKKRKK